jgi:hypothetical protein
LRPCWGRCGHERALIGACGCHEDRCGCGFVFKEGWSDHAKAQHWDSKKHKQWVATKPSGLQSLGKWFPKAKQADEPKESDDVDDDDEENLPELANDDYNDGLDGPFDKHGRVEDENEDKDGRGPLPQAVEERGAPVGGLEDECPCAGYLPDGMTADDLVENYPWQIHSQKGKAIPRWAPKITWTLAEGLTSIRSKQCTGKGLGGKPCKNCADLAHCAPLQGALQKARVPKSGTPFEMRGMKALISRLHEMRAEREHHFQEKGNLKRRFLQMVRM